MAILRKLGRSFLLLAVVIGLGVQLRSPVTGLSQSPALQPIFQPTPEEIIVPTQRGLEKLAPDLKSLVEETLGEGEGKAAAEWNAARQDRLISVMIQPGTDVRRYFIRSATSRRFGAFQWVVGEIDPAQLVKLASLPGVIGIHSTDTYQTTEAPGLDDLRAGFPRLDSQEARSFLVQGGPDFLRQQLQREDLQAIERAPALPVTQVASASIPSLLDVHDVQRVWDEGYQGEGVVVAVVDTGVDFSHPDLQGTQALISHGVYADWPFAYDVLSGARYAMNMDLLLNPQNLWSVIGMTQYVGTLPVSQETCLQTTCTASLLIGEDEETGVQVVVSWPNNSKSGNYLYSVHPDILLLYAAYYLGIDYPGVWSTPLMIVSDENAAGSYDTVYVDVNFNQVLGDEGEKLDRHHLLGGADLTGDDIWDLSAGMLAWISDGENYPPGVEVLYPAVAASKPPQSGRLLAFINDQNGHGTNCASEIAGQARITDPQGIGPANPLYAGGGEIGGVGTPVIQRMAPGATIAAFENGFSLPLDAWTLAVVGMDGIKNNGDEVQIVSNSWGDSRTIEDGWDSVSRYAQQLSIEDAPTISFLAATGNGGPGYGTVTSPGGASILDVGASTAYGALRGFEGVGTEQFLYGEVQPWSNRGPGGLGDVAPDIVAVGAWGTGAQPLNYYFGDGQAAYDIFGGTSMSTPIAAGNLALIYQAFRAQQPQNAKRWPDWKEARAILLNGAETLGYDVFTQGSGNIQAGRSVDVVAGRLAWVEPQQWQPGKHPDSTLLAYPNYLYPGEEDSQVFTIHNPTSQPVTYDIAHSYLKKQYEETFTFSYTPPAPSSQYNLPVFLEDLTSRIGTHNPALVRVQVNFPFESFDVNSDSYADNWWRVFFYDWTDHDLDGRLWVDANRNGMVDEAEIDIDQTTGIYEFNRFTYGYPQSTTLEASLGGQGMAQKHDGIYLGLDCYYCGESVTLQVRLTFYEKADWDWLSLSPSLLVVPAQGQAEFTATIKPTSANPGIYDSSIELLSDQGNHMIPLVVILAANSSTFKFGGAPAQETPYENGYLFGGFNWNWRYESGDWRSFYYDLAQGSAGPGKSMLVDTRWDVPKTDIDTWILGKPQDQEPQLDPDIFGPQGMRVIGGSVDAYRIRGVFGWMTNTGMPHELVGVPLSDGLGMIALHNVLTGGGQPVEGFSGSVFQFSSDPGEVDLHVKPESAQQPYLVGSQDLTFTSTGDIPEGIQVRAYGFSTPVNLTDQVVTQNSANNICSAGWIYRRNSRGLKIAHGGLLDITTSSVQTDTDLDVYLFQDNGDGRWSCGKETLVNYSINAGSEEQIKIYFPSDGVYWIVVHGYYVPQDQQLFDIQIQAVQGAELKLINLPSGPVTAGVPVNLKVKFQTLYGSNTPSISEGMLLIGPPAVPALVEVPVRLSPTILLYPQPALESASRWVRQTPQEFRLSFQNQGGESETVQAEVDIPAGLEYLTDSAAAPEASPVYDVDLRKLTWRGTVAAGERIEITFLAYAQPGYTPGQAELHARVAGEISEQVWYVNTSIWLNLYGQILPFISR